MPIRHSQLSVSAIAPSIPAPLPALALAFAFRFMAALHKCKVARAVGLARPRRAGTTAQLHMPACAVTTTHMHPRSRTFRRTSRPTRALNSLRTNTRTIRSEWIEGRDVQACAPFARCYGLVVSLIQVCANSNLRVHRSWSHRTSTAVRSNMLSRARRSSAASCSGRATRTTTH